jgi:hypothetical protein
MKTQEEEGKKRKEKKKKRKSNKRKKKEKQQRNKGKLLPTAKNRTGNLPSRVAGQLLYHDVFFHVHVPLRSR